MSELLGSMKPQPLFEAKHIRLLALDADADADADTIMGWSNNVEAYAMISDKPARPLSSGQAKALLQPAGASDSPGQFKFGIRLLEEDRLVGLAEILDVDWRHGTAWLVVKIGAEADRGRGYGKEAMGLLLRFAFDELNLYRVNVKCEAYQVRGAAFLKELGFQEEVRRRQAVFRNGQRWDALIFGLAHGTWKENHG